ncbi:MAG TPA: hypothetical protein VLD85_01010 [Anaeromyxobacteraceae bacterium]|nr:hypothetical protein [Anaeromyxobacteraceae bacterium]
MRHAALLAAALAVAGCGSGNSAEKHYLSQLRAVCDGLPGKTLSDSGGEFSSLGIFAIDDGCRSGLLPPSGTCPAGAVLCRVVWFWQPSDARLCSPFGSCLYQCEAFAAGVAGPVSTGTEVVCGSDSSGP